MIFKTCFEFHVIMLYSNVNMSVYNIIVIPIDLLLYYMRVYNILLFYARYIIYYLPETNFLFKNIIITL